MYDRKSISPFFKNLCQVVVVILFIAVFCSYSDGAIKVIKKQSLPEWGTKKHKVNFKEVNLEYVVRSFVPDDVQVTMDKYARQAPVTVNGRYSMKDILENLVRLDFIEYQMNDGNLEVRGYTVKEFELPQFPVQYQYSQNYSSTGLGSSGSGSGSSSSPSGTDSTGASVPSTTGASETGSSETGSSGGGGGGTYTSVGLSSDQNFWSEIKDQIENILNVQSSSSSPSDFSSSSPSPGFPPSEAKIPPSEAKIDIYEQKLEQSNSEAFVAVNPSASLIMVGSTVKKMKQVEKYINKVKNKLLDSVEVELTFLEIRDTNNTEYGVSWAATLTNLLHTYDHTALSLSGTSVTDITGSSYSANIHSTAHPDEQNLIINALKQVADVSILEKTTILLRNNTAGGFSTGTETSYIDSITQDLSTEGGVSSYAISKGTILSGIDISISVTLNKDVITLTMIPKLSTLKNMETLELSGVKVQNPTIDIRKSITTIVVKDGETKAIVGYNSKNRQALKERVPILGDIPLVGWLFGKTKNVDERTSIVMLITPRIKKLDEY